MRSDTKSLQIDYYTVDGYCGGCQAWFEDYWMRIGGCAALAAGDLAICLSKNYGLKACCPFDPMGFTREKYIEYSLLLKPYIRPRPGGVVFLSSYTKGIKKYLRECGFDSDFVTCPAKTDVKEAEDFLVSALKRNLPVACLILGHKNPDFKGLRWHWFSITGYSRRGDRFYIQYHTYGQKRKVDFQALWETGSMIRGGMVALSDIRPDGVLF